MKKTVKILIAALFAVSFSSLANAQSASISANATVISELKVTNQANLNFGTIIIGQTKSIYSDNSVVVSTGNSLGNTNRGQFSLSAGIGSNLTLTFVLPSSLTTTGGAILPISFTDDNPNNLSSAIGFEDGDGNVAKVTPGIPYVINGYNSASEVKNANVFVGGQVDATGVGVSTGIYTGTITLSATYN